MMKGIFGGRPLMQDPTNSPLLAAGVQLLTPGGTPAQAFQAYHAMGERNRDRDRETATIDMIRSGKGIFGQMSAEERDLLAQYPEHGVAAAIQNSLRRFQQQGMTPYQQGQLDLARKEFEWKTRNQPLPESHYEKTAAGELAKADVAKRIAQEKGLNTFQSMNAGIDKLKALVQDPNFQPGVLNSSETLSPVVRMFNPAVADHNQKIRADIEQLIFPMLENMKGLGAMSEKEFETVRNSVGNVLQSSGPQAAVELLENLRANLTLRLQSIGIDPRAVQGQAQPAQAQAQPQMPQQVQTLEEAAQLAPEGAMIQAPNGQAFVKRNGQLVPTVPMSR